MPLINCKIHLELSWTKNCVMSNVAADTTFKKTITNLYVPIVILSIKDKVKLTKQWNEGIKRPAYWKEYKNKIESKEADDNLTRFYLDGFFQGTKRLFVLAFNNTDDSEKLKETVIENICFSRANITNYNVLIDGRKFYNQPINDQIKKYEEIRKIATGQGDDYTTGCLLDYQYFKDDEQLIAVDLSKQKN